MTDAAVLDGAAAAAESAGTLLRRAREAAGLHVAALAVSLKVPVAKLDALENDRYDELPSPVFARALAASMCRTLKIDAQPVLERLPQHAAPRLVPDSDGINEPFRVPGEGHGLALRDQAKRPVFLVVAALLLGVIALLVLPLIRRDEQAVKPDLAPKSVASAGVKATPQPEPANEASANPVPAEAVDVNPPPGATATGTVKDTPASSRVEPGIVTTAPSEPSSAKAAALSTPQPVLQSSASSASAGAATSASAPVAVSAAPSAAAPIPSGLVVFRATGESWVEVTDAKGAVSLRKTLAAGESAGASGVLPLRVTVGRSDLTTVSVRGKPLDMRPVSKDNVARFEVK